MRSRGRDEDAEFLLDWMEIEMGCSLVETSSEVIDSESAGLMTWEGQAVAVADASGGVETYSFFFTDMKEQEVSRS